MDLLVDLEPPPGHEDALELVVIGPQRPTIVGRLGTCDVLSENVHVSRRHARVDWDGLFGFRVMDLGSGGGTQLWRRGAWCQVPRIQNNSWGLFGSWGDYIRLGGRRGEMFRVMENPPLLPLVGPVFTRRGA